MSVAAEKDKVVQHLKKNADRSHGHSDVAAAIGLTVAAVHSHMEMLANEGKLARVGPGQYKYQGFKPYVII